MIRLTSKWKLKSGLTAELMCNLESAAEQVQTEESSSLMYIVHVGESQALTPSAEQATSSSDNTETAITFIELYKNSAEYDQRNKGRVFAKFREQNLKYFVEDPKNPGWPVIESQIVQPSHFQKGQLETGIQI